MSKIKLLFAVTSLCSFSAVAGDADIQLPVARPGEFFPRRGHEPGDFVFRPVRLRRRRGVRPLGILPHPRAAGPPLHARGFPHHLGDVQNLSVAAGKIPRRALGAHRGVHDLLFFRAAGTSRSARCWSSWPVPFSASSAATAWRGLASASTPPPTRRAAFAALRGNPLKTLFIPLQAGMSIGLLLICVELACMIGILAFIPAELAGPCFIGFAIGESLGASALRIGGGIFTKIADIGSRPDENRFQPAGRRSEKSRRHRRLHRRQRRRFGRADGGRF